MGPQQAKLLVLATVVALQGHWSKAAGTLFVGSPQILRAYGLDSISRRMDLDTALQFENAFSSAGRLWDRAQKLLKATESATKDIEVLWMNEEIQPSKHRNSSKGSQVSSVMSQWLRAWLGVGRLAQWYSVCNAISRLMMQVLSGNGAGLTSVHAEPGVGKSIGEAVDIVAQATRPY